MSRWFKRTLLAFSGLVALAAIAGTAYQWKATRDEVAATPPPGRLVDVGGHRLHIWCTGAGTPSVILETGLGGSAVDWGLVQPEVATFTQVCSYDRAGMGYSDPGPSPRTARRIARELHDLIDRGGIGSPAILAGASLGGFSVRVLASEHPERVAGLVLVDASHENQRHDIPRLAPFVPVLSSTGIFRLLGVSFGPPPQSLAPPVRRFAEAIRFRSAGHRAAADEISHIQDSAAEVRETRRTLTMPVIVVTGGRGAVGEWQDLQLDQVRLSTRGCQIVAEGSGHVVPLDRPDVVVEAIRAVVESARGGEALPCERRTRS